MIDEFVTDEYAKLICKIGQGEFCCRYLAMSGNGWSCEKHGSMAAHLDMRVAKGTITARGDNCAGRKSR